MVTPKTDTEEGKHKEVKGENDKTDYGEMVKDCPECRSRNLSYDFVKGELICNGCGLVIVENFFVDHCEKKS
jgi:ribosomal protein S27E